MVCFESDPNRGWIDYRPGLINCIPLLQKTPFHMNRRGISHPPMNQEDRVRIVLLNVQVLSNRLSCVVTTIICSCFVE